MRTIIVWTACLLILAIVVAAEATWSLIGAGQECFVDFPNTPCPTVGDPALIRLTFAFVGLPLIWFVGLALAFVGRELRHRRARRSSPR
jgi:hypothetical protein